MEANRLADISVVIPQSAAETAASVSLMEVPVPLLVSIQISSTSITAFQASPLALMDLIFWKLWPSVNTKGSLSVYAWSQWHCSHTLGTELDPLVLVFSATQTHHQASPRLSSPLHWWCASCCFFPSHCVEETHFLFCAVLLWLFQSREWEVQKLAKGRNGQMDVGTSCHYAVCSNPPTPPLNGWAGPAHNINLLGRKLMLDNDLIKIWLTNGLCCKPEKVAFILLCILSSESTEYMLFSSIYEWLLRANLQAIMKELDGRTKHQVLPEITADVPMYHRFSRKVHSWGTVQKTIK